MTARRSGPIRFVAIGASAADSLRMLGANSDVIMSCVTNDNAALEIYAGAQGALTAAKPGTIVIEMSTVSPETSRRLSELGRERGWRFWMFLSPGARRQPKRGL